MKESIYAGLGKLGAFEPCPRCRHKSFEVLDGFAHITLHPEPTELDDTKIINGPKMTAAITMCSHCGYIAMHQLSKVVPANSIKQPELVEV